MFIFNLILFMKSRFKIRKRLNSTKLKVFEKATLVAGNSSALMEKVTTLLDIGATTIGSVYSAEKAATDIAHAVEDYACSDYKCFTLDCIASGCDLAAAGIAFLPKNTATGFAFAGCSATSKFARTLRQKCKEMKGGLLGCRD
jgi:hypothetical protein